MSELERRYARLMRAYPRAYRREHGREIITTLMDGAGPDRDRPTARETRDVLLGGLRRRFRLPVGRLMVLAAILTALTVGGMGAALGSALGWATVPSPPSRAAVADMADVALGQPVAPRVSLQPEYHGLTYQVMAGAQVSDPAAWSTERAAERLRAAGWTVRPVEVFSGSGDASGLVARRDGLVLDLTITKFPAEVTTAGLTVQPAAPAPVVPLTALGAVAGLIAGWLLTARVGYRLRRAGPWPRCSINGVAALAGLLLGLKTVLAWLLAEWAVQAAVTGAELHGLAGRPVPGAYTAYTVDAGPPQFTLAGLLLAGLAVALAMLTRPARPRHTHEPVA